MFNDRTPGVPDHAPAAQGAAASRLKASRLAANRYHMPDPTVALTDAEIMRHIPAGSRVLDLGCGDGRLLERLRDSHGCHVQGVELNRADIVACLRRGVPVIHADLDRGLAEVPDDSFDYAVLSQTLQQLKYPKRALEEILRVGRRALVVVPNFGYWRGRLDYLLWGRAPVTQQLPYEWYNTPNLHFMSMPDFRDLTQRLGIRIIKELPIIRHRAVDRAWAANWRAEIVVYVLERPEHHAQRPTDHRAPDQRPPDHRDDRRTAESSPSGASTASRGEPTPSRSVTSEPARIDASEE